MKPPSTRAANRRFYDALWSASYVVPPQRFNTWPLLTSLAASAPARLEIACVRGSPSRVHPSSMSADRLSRA